MWHGPKQECVHIYGITFLCLWIRRAGQGSTGNSKSKRTINTNAEKDCFILTIHLPRTHQGVLSHAGLKVKEKSIMSMYHLCRALTPCSLFYASNVLGLWPRGEGVKSRHQSQRHLLGKRDPHIGNIFVSGRTFPQLPLHSATTATSPDRVSQKRLNSLKINDAPVSPGKEA